MSLKFFSVTFFLMLKLHSFILPASFPLAAYRAKAAKQADIPIRKSQKSHIKDISTLKIQRQKFLYI